MRLIKVEREEEGREGAGECDGAAVHASAAFVLLNGIGRLPFRGERGIAFLFPLLLLIAKTKSDQVRIIGEFWKKKKVKTRTTRTLYLRADLEEMISSAKS